MKSILTLLSIFLFACPIFSQDLNGTVKDDVGEAIFFATAALYQASDSTMAMVESTDDKGKFTFKKVKDGDYYLVVTMLGYDDAEVASIQIPQALDKPLNISLKSAATTLSTIEVTAKTPLLEQQADKLIVNVADNITNTSGSLLDVMKKVPGMVVINDRLSLAGAGSPTIYLNGKSTQYMDVQSLLRDMPGDNIKKVEIIHQPGAEYEAAGSGPIINIVMKKNALFGTNGSVSVGAGKGQVWDYTTGVNLSHYEGNFNLMGGFGYSQNAWVDELDITRRLSNISEEVNGTYTQTNLDIARPLTYRGNIRMDWDMTDQHRLGVEAKYYNSDNQRTAINRTNVDLINEAFSDYQLVTENEHKRSWTYFSINPYYIFEIDTAGQKLELDFNYASYNRDGFNKLASTNNIDLSVERQNYFQPGDNDIMASALDYTKPFGKKLTLKMGLKYSNAALDNNLISEYMDGEGIWRNNVDQSNHFIFTEDIYAAYSKVDWNAGEWSGTAGLRFEKSISKGESVTLDSTLSRDITQLFPSFSISRNINKQLKTTFAYSYRIDRPRYSSLNPFVYYLDPFTYEQGNPTLRPELTHSAKLTLSYENQPFFNVEYKRSTNAIVEVTNQETDSEEAFKTDVNFDNRDQFSASLFFPLSFIKGFDGYGGVILSNTSFDSNFLDAQFAENKWNTTAFLQAEFKLPWDINAELGGWFTSSNQEGIFKSEYLYGTSFGISKKFLDNKAKISLGVEDFANRFWYAHVDYQQDMDLVSRWQAPVVNARFSYKFGNQHLKSQAKRKGAASDEIRRAQ